MMLTWEEVFWYCFPPLKIDGSVKLHCLFVHCTGTTTQIYKAQDNLEKLMAFVHAHTVKHDLKEKKITGM